MFIRNGETSTPRAWNCSCSDFGAAEDERADDSPERVPSGEDHERDGDEAAPRGHAFVPCQRDRQREMRAADPAERARERQRLVLHLLRPAPGGESRGGRFTDRAQHEPPAGAEQEPPIKALAMRDGEPDQEEVRDAPRCGQTRHERADERAADQRARAKAEKHQAQARGELVGPAFDHESCKDQLASDAGQGRRDDAEIRVGGHGGARRNRPRRRSASGPRGRD